MKYILILSILLTACFADYVSGYTRSNGTYVYGYTRSHADSSVYNNYSYKPSRSSYYDNTWKY